MPRIARNAPPARHGAPPRGTSPTLALVALIALVGLAAPGAGALAQGTGTPGATPAAQTSPEPAGAEAGTPTEAGGVRTTDSRVIDTTREDLEREQGQTEQERDRARREQEQRDRRQLDHRMQVGVRVGFGYPYRFRLEYGSDDAAQCESTEGTDETFCNGPGEPMLDIGLDFAVASTLELFAVMRLGLASEEFTGAGTLQVGLGIRSYTNGTDLFKVYFGGALTFDFGTTERPGVGDYGSLDFGVRGQIGFQFDVIRYLGIYLQIDPSLFFLRYLDVALGGSIGLQGRFP